MFGNSIFGSSYFGEPESPRGATGSGTLTQSAQTCSGIGNTQQTQPAGGGGSSFHLGATLLRLVGKQLRKKPEAPALPLRISGSGYLEQQSQTCRGLGHVLTEAEIEKQNEEAIEILMLFDAICDQIDEEESIEAAKAKGEAAAQAMQEAVAAFRKRNLTIDTIHIT